MATKTTSTLTRVGGDPVFKRFQRAPAFAKEPKQFPTFETEIERGIDGSDPVLQSLIQRLGGDSSLAKRILSLQKKFPVATIPEMIVYDWLRREGLSFEFQVEILGGRNFSGGLVPDFVLYQDRTNADIWQVQGDYFHSISRKGFHDQTSQWRMLGQIVNGATVKRVIELWERDLYALRPQIFYLALAGISMRGIGGV